jgi:hypothetical protein
METVFQDRLPKPGEAAAVGIVELEDGLRFRPVAETHAWNFQQGALAQWLPPARDRRIIYNDWEGDRLVSVILDIFDGSRRVLPHPIYAVSPDGRYALSVSFARVLYYYPGAIDPWAGEEIPEEDGIYWMDLATCERRLILSYAQVAAHGEKPSVGNGNHWIEHLMINPDASRFLFLHRYPFRDGGYCTRLLTANPDGSDLCLLASGSVTHMCWRNPSQVLAWARRPSLATEARKRGLFARPMFRWLLRLSQRQIGNWARRHVIGDCYRLFTDRTRESETVGGGVLDDDGHCTYSPDGRWIVTDTYPDPARHRPLILYHPETSRRVDVGRFLAFALDGSARCDLHPRWSPDGKRICIDSQHEGTRQMYEIDVEHVVG